MNSFTSPRARRPVNARVNAVSPAVATARRCGSLRARLRREQKRRTDLRGSSAGGERCAHPRAIGDPARRDQRQLHRGGRRAQEVMQRRRRRRRSSSQLPRWPPASAPCTTSASAPASSRRLRLRQARHGQPRLGARCTNASDVGSLGAAERERDDRRRRRRAPPRASRRSRRRRSAARRVARRAAPPPAVTRPHRPRPPRRRPSRRARRRC